MSDTTVIYDPAEGVGSLADVRPGDHADIEVQIDGEWRRSRDCDVWQSRYDDLWAGAAFVRYADGEPDPNVRVLRVTRQVLPMPPLPTTPGDVILATVSGVEGVRLMHTPNRFGIVFWFSPVMIDGRHWHSAEDITAWEPIAVQEVTR